MTSERKTVANSIRKYVGRQNNNWKFVMGRDMLAKDQFLLKFDNDTKFRSFVVTLVVDLSLDILNRGAKK